MLRCGKWVLSAVVLCSFASEAQAADPVFPASQWATKTPSEVQLNASVLEDLADLVGGSGMVVRHGYQVFTWGNPSQPIDWASASKPVISTLLFMAEDQGLATLVTPMGDLLSGGSAKDNAITFLQLANMTSGYHRGEAAGDAWAYNDVAINLYGYALFHGVYGASPSTVVANQFAFLDFEDTVTVSNTRYGRIEGMSLRDFARIGWFWLSRGQWNGTQEISDIYFWIITNLVPASLPQTAQNGSGSWSFGTFGGGEDQSILGPGHYGMNFWVNTNGLWPGVPEDAFQANGHFGGEVCTVIPSLGLVVVGKGDWGNPTTAALQLLVAADSDVVTSTAESSVDVSSWGGIKSRYRE